jgi:hypothetical protein
MLGDILILGILKFYIQFGYFFGFWGNIALQNAFFL